VKSLLRAEGSGSAGALTGKKSCMKTVYFAESAKVRARCRMIYIFDPVPIIRYHISRHDGNSQPTGLVEDLSDHQPSDRDENSE
jgi:hypothetical protein